MVHCEVMFDQISQLRPPSDGGISSQSFQGPVSYTGSGPSRQRHNSPQELQPSLALSLEGPGSYANFAGPYPPASSRPFKAQSSQGHSLGAQKNVVRPFDLEKLPVQHPEKLNPSNHIPNHDDVHISVHLDAHCGKNTDHYEVPSKLNGSSPSRQADIAMPVDISHDENNHQKCYPRASANHEDVIQDPKLFMSTFQELHEALGTTLTIPKLGGKEINLHLFYCHMTARGGLEQVIKACQWRELSDALDIPKNICSASFVLRKLYSKLLFHYEQVYYFRMEGQLQSPPVSLPAPNPVGQRVDDASPYEIPVDLKASYKKRKRKLDPLQVFGVDPVASVGSVATGAINGKFEDGYFITVVVGTEKLSGVLYHLPASNNTQQYANIPSLIDTIGHEGNAPGMELQLYKFKKKRDYVRKFNPDAPKRTRSAYNIFFKEQCARLKQLLPGKKGLGKTVTEMWNKLSDKEKEPYIARGSQERERYLAEHREKLRLRREVGSEGVHNSIGHSAAVYDGSHDYHVSLDAVHDIHGRNPRISDVGQPYGVYNGSEHAYISESEITDIHLVSNQVHENHENEGNYLQGTLSEGDDDGDAHLEEQYEEEDMQDCPLSENGYEEENGTEYHVSDPAQEVSGYPTSERNPDVPEDVYRPQTDEISVQETEEHGCDTAPKAPFYTHDHGYNYGSSVSQEQMAETPRSNNAAHFEHMVYQMHNNGQVMYTPAQQGCPESSANSSLAMPQQHYFPHSRYAYRPGQGGEALGLPVPQDQGSFSRQDEGSPFLASYQQSQSLGTGSHAQQIPSEVAYRGRYTYPLAMPYSHVYTQPPHAYGQCFPRPPYPLQPNDAVTYQYQHGYVSQVHQPLACVPEGSGMQSSQMYQPHDGGRVLHFQDGNSRPVFKHGADK